MLSRLVAASCVLSLAAQLALAQQSNPPRKIAPERFPAYGGVSDAVAAVSVIPATDELPYGACNKELPRRQRTLCLQQTSELMDGLAAEAVKNAMTAIAARPSVGQGQRGLADRGIAEAQELWRKQRDLECGSLVGFDLSLDGDTYERRLRCLVRSDRERIDTLARRYGNGAGLR
jgi:uncharacterized protein YecT (DUF1311 family)